MSSSEKRQISLKSDRVSLSLATDGKIKPGDVLNGTINLSSFSHCNSLEVFLVGSSSVTVMGKRRWQVAQATTSMQAPLITSIETHVFCRVSQTVWQASEEAEIDKGNATKENGSVGGQFQFELRVPNNRTCTHSTGAPIALPASLPGLHPEDTSGIQIEYFLVAHLRRKFLRRDEKVTLPLILIHEGEPPVYSTEKNDYSSVKIRRPLKYQSSEGNLEMEAELTIRKPITRAAKIQYRISWKIPGQHPPSISMSNPPHIDVEVKISLARRCLTRPIDHPGNGEEFKFAPIQIATGVTNTDKDQSCDPAHDNSLIQGSLQVPESEFDIDTCGAVVQHTITARITSTSLLSPLALVLPVFLPSSAI